MASAYSATERLIAKALSSFPGLKPLVKKSYQQLNATIYKKNYRFRASAPLHTLPLQQETFFGYYDSSPLSTNNRHLLYYASSRATSSPPAAAEPIQLGVYNIETGELGKKITTDSYNWQQGARAQWLSADRFIYNRYNAVQGRFQSVITASGPDDTSGVGDTSGTGGENSAGAPGGESDEKIIDFPICDCFRDEYALSLNFERLMALRADYGYRNKPPLTPDALKNTDDDGVFHIDLKTGAVRLIVTLSELAKIPHPAATENALHKVNHLMISPDGSRFIFLHRFFVNGRRFDRLFVAGSDGTGLKLLADDDMVSHCCWRGNDEIIGYLRHREQGDKYYRIPVSGGQRQAIGEGVIDRFGDGHPSVHENKLLLDTYPDKSRMKHLYLFDMETGKLDQLGEFYESFRYYGESRCDLHPRFSPDGTKVFFDSVHEGMRKLYWIAVK